MPRPNYEQIEEILEIELAQDHLNNWRILTAGQYRLNERLDIFPKSKKFFFVPKKLWGNYFSIQQLIDRFL